MNVLKDGFQVDCLDEISVLLLSTKIETYIVKKTYFLYWKQEDIKCL